MKEVVCFNYSWMVACRRRVSRRLAGNYKADNLIRIQLRKLRPLSNTALAPKKAGTVSIYIHFSGAEEVFIYTLSGVIVTSYK